MKLDLIVRVSRKGDRDNLRSPEQQEADVRRWAQAHGYEIAIVHREIDSSGKTTNRPALNRAKARALSGEVDGIAAAYLSRFSRNTVEGLLLVQELLDADRRFVALDCPFDLRTPDGRRFLTYELANAQAERERATLAFKRGVAESIARGVHIGVPFGYRRSGGRATPLVIDEAEAPAVRLAFRMRADGHSWQAIADALNASEISPRPYKRSDVVKQAVWTHKTARQLVVGREGDGNRVYVGTAWNGAHATENAHPAIVDADLLAAANEARGTKPVGPDEGHLLSGLVRCRGCGYVMTYNGREWIRCRAAQHGDGRCPAQTSVNARQLEALVVADFKLRLRGGLDVSGSEASEAVSEAVAETRRLAMRHANVLSLMPDDLSGAQGENWRAQERAAAEALAAAERREAEARDNVRGARLPADLTADTFDTWPIPDQRTFLSALFAAVVVRASERWREPVADRYGIIRRDQSPAHPTALIARIAGA